MVGVVEKGTGGTRGAIAAGIYYLPVTMRRCRAQVERAREEV